MFEEMIICKILKEKSLKIISNNGLSPDMFLTHGDEINFIIDHFHRYDIVPDVHTFKEKFRDFDFVDVTESDEYLVYRLREAFMYRDVVPILTDIQDVVRTDSIKAVQLLKEKIDSLLRSHSVRVGNWTDIIRNADDRLEDYLKRVDARGILGISTGVEMLDNLLHGWLGEDLIILLARTNKGKTWLLLFFLVVAWKLGHKVLLYSGEMSPGLVGFRVDTLNGHFSNSGLMSGSVRLGKGEDDLDSNDYREYINRLKQKEGFYVVTPDDFGGNKPTVSQLCDTWDLCGADILGVDQISLMRDQRRGENKTMMYANISEDLFLATQSRQKPIIALAQAGRESERIKSEDGTPELHHIEYADAVGQNATRVIAMNTVDGVLKLTIRKNRYGTIGNNVLLMWDINYGIVKPLLDGDTSEIADEYGF